jgi:hypothetical protein
MRHRGDDHSEDFREQPEAAGLDVAQDLEGALIQRLRTMSWPRPTSEQRERCLEQILDRMADEKTTSRYESSRFESKQEQRYSLTRLSRPAPMSLPAPRRQVRLATIL